jgi:hypothetical protein
MGAELSVKSGRGEGFFMKTVEIRFTGTTPLLCHNVQLADPDNDIVMQIKAITSKRKKTAEDRADIAKLEWYGGLYLGKDGPCYPTAGLRKCLINAGKINKLGSTLLRALHFVDFQVPIVYAGPRDIDKLFLDKKFQHRAMVAVSTAKTVRVRPHFAEWSVTAKAGLLDDVLDMSDLVRVVEIAGVAEGLGDGRRIGFGRFQGSVKAA